MPQMRNCGRKNVIHIRSEQEAWSEMRSLKPETQRRPMPWCWSAEWARSDQPAVQYTSSQSSGLSCRRHYSGNPQNVRLHSLNLQTTVFCTTEYLFFNSFIHMCVHCLGHFSPQNGVHCWRDEKWV
jgi:hypothetical protein